MKRQFLISALAALSLVAAGSAYAGGDLARGKALSKKCASCHGADGKGVKKNPPIVGISAADFAKDLHDYKSGAKKHKMMNILTKKMSDDDIQSLALYYSSMK
jgi:cytochrome c553